MSAGSLRYLNKALGATKPRIHGQRPTLALVRLSRCNSCLLMSVAVEGGHHRVPAGAGLEIWREGVSGSGRGTNGERAEWSG
jgi:hypothetical protein